MPRPRRRPKKPLIDFSGTQKTIDILRNGNVGLHRFQDRIDDEEESAAHDAEVQRHRNEANRLTVGDPRRIEAERHLDFLSGAPYLAWRKLKLFPRKAWRQSSRRAVPGSPDPSAIAAHRGLQRRRLPIALVAAVWLLLI